MLFWYFDPVQCGQPTISFHIIFFNPVHCEQPTICFHMFDILIQCTLGSLQIIFIFLRKAQIILIIKYNFACVCTLEHINGLRQLKIFIFLFLLWFCIFYLEDVNLTLCVTVYQCDCEFAYVHLEDVNAVEHDGVHPAELLPEHEHQGDDEGSQVWAGGEIDRFDSIFHNF